MAKNELSEEDKALFRQAMKMVTPLKKNSQVVITPPAPVPIRLQKTKSLPNTFNSEIPSTSSFHLSNFYPEEVQSHTTLSFCLHSIPAKRLIALKQGQIAWQARLDLHGLRPDDAQQALVNFILHASAVNYRCLLIIHGKGGVCGEAPILKNLVNHWLRQLPQILAFHSASPKDGGTGALYILLKRNRIDTID